MALGDRSAARAAPYAGHERRGFRQTPAHAAELGLSPARLDLPIGGGTGGRHGRRQPSASQSVRLSAVSRQPVSQSPSASQPVSQSASQSVSRQADGQTGGAVRPSCMASRHAARRDVADDGRGAGFSP